MSSYAALAYHRPTERPIHLAPSLRSWSQSYVIYRGFASKLHHEVPHWVESGAPFHIRIRLDGKEDQPLLVDPRLGKKLLHSASFYEMKQRWHITIFLLMPDHIHAILSFARDEPISEIIGQWKHYHAHTNDVRWQEGFFDHRLRDDERGEQLSAKFDYIRQNPVVKGFCAKAEDWPWVIDPHRNGYVRWNGKVDRPLRGRC